MARAWRRRAAPARTSWHFSPLVRTTAPSPPQARNSGMTVCSVKLALSGSGNAEVVLNSASDGSGTDYGSASGVQALGGSFAEVTFTWTSNPTVSAGTHYYIVARGNGGGSISGYQVSTGDVYEAGNSYDGYQNGSVITTTDLRFELRTIQ
jgi:hypothetical protein